VLGFLLPQPHAATLPLISLGGTSTLFTCLSIAMIISVSRGKGDVDEDQFVDENNPLDYVE
jgi:cell division protein FtsW (lipid II flippase)